eukprot:gene11767-8405_t
MTPLLDTNGREVTARRRRRTRRATPGRLWADCGGGPAEVS